MIIMDYYDYSESVYNCNIYYNNDLDKTISKPSNNLYDDYYAYSTTSDNYIN